VSCHSSIGFTADEILDMAMMVGADSNVVAMDVSELLPEIEVRGYIAPNLAPIYLAPIYLAPICLAPI
jgi:arginase family enzyme